MIVAWVPGGGVIRDWLVASGVKVSGDMAGAAAVVATPGTDGFEAAWARAEAAGLVRVACIPVQRDDDWFCADGAEGHAGVRADAYASCAGSLGAALAYALAEDRGARDKGALRVVWLGALGELFPSDLPIGHAVALGPERTLIGRLSDNAVVLRQGPHSDQCTVARRHAALERIGGQVRVRDLGSTNGTWVGGRRVDEAVIGPGDEIALCGRIRLRIDGAG